jgi:uncharacterized protein
LRQAASYAEGVVNCPRCANTVLDEREREGILVDVCPSCRGVWLDRGELEKFIARATREFDDVYARGPDSPPRVVGREHHEDSNYGRHPKRKRGWMDALGDIFD